jgi:hypothetical protein
MIDISEASLGIDAGCSSDVPVNVNTRFQGTVNYRLVNAGDEDGLVDILATLSDSVGNSTHFSSTFQAIPASGDFSDSHLLFLDASYVSPGEITVTMRVEFSGAFTDSKFAECSFFVTQ